MVAVTWRPGFVQLCVKICQSSKNVHPLVSLNLLLSKTSILMMYHKIKTPIQTYRSVQHKTVVCAPRNLDLVFIWPTIFKTLDHPVLGYESP